MPLSLQKKWQSTDKYNLKNGNLAVHDPPYMKIGHKILLDWIQYEQNKIRLLSAKRKDKRRKNIKINRNKQINDVKWVVNKTEELWLICQL